MRFSTAVRETSKDVHQRAERTRFVEELLGGRLPREAYGRLLDQHAAVYGVLEAAAATMRDDPVAGPFASPALDRSAAIAADRAFWGADGGPLPATAAYVERLREVCFDWPGGFVAHHYARYLGDLSGGFVVARAVARAYGLEGEDGLRFYAFPAIPDPAAFKDRYRAQLDAAPWDDDERARVVDEVLRAYDLVTGVFDELV